MFYGTCERNPESISCANTGFIPKHGFQNYFKILLANDWKYDVFLTKNIVLGHLEYISWVSTLPVKTRTLKQPNMHINQGLT